MAGPSPTVTAEHPVAGSRDLVRQTTEDYLTHPGQAGTSCGSRSMSRFSTIRNQKQYELLRDHPLVARLRGILWHVTSTQNFADIRTDLCVRPNDGTAVGLYKRKAHGLTACEQLDSVSLFDFSKSDDEIFDLSAATESVGEYSLEWGKFLWCYKPVSLILTFDPTVVAHNVLPRTECERVKGQWIYNVEVCHRGPIPFDAISEVLVVQQDGRFEVKEPNSKDI